MVGKRRPQWGRVDRGCQGGDGGARSANALAAKVVAAHPPPTPPPSWPPRDNGGGGRRGGGRVCASAADDGQAGQPARRQTGPAGARPPRARRRGHLWPQTADRQGQTSTIHGGGGASTRLPSIPHRRTPPQAYSPTHHRLAPLPGSACGGGCGGGEARGGQWLADVEADAAIRGGGTGEGRPARRAGEYEPVVRTPRPTLPLSEAAACVARGTGCTDRPAAAAAPRPYSPIGADGRQGLVGCAWQGQPRLSVWRGRPGAGLSGATPRLSCGTRGAPPDR